jgi:hypothetical protein
MPTPNEVVAALERKGYRVTRRNRIDRHPEGESYIRLDHPSGAIVEVDPMLHGRKWTTFVRFIPPGTTHARFWPAIGSTTIAEVESMAGRATKP